MNLRAKIARLEARIPTGPAAEPGLIGRLMRRLGDLHTYEELMDMSGRAFDECMAAAASGEPAPTAAESARTLRGMIAQAEERWKSEGRELPEYAWVDRQAWGVR